MVLDNEEKRSTEAVIRSLATAGKALRLYPSTSEIPMQSVDSALTALVEYFRDGRPVLSLAVAREGFSACGESVGLSVLGAADLANELRMHGVAELDIVPGCTSEEILTFLKLVMQSPDEARRNGGISTQLVAEGVDAVRVTDVQLTVLESVGPAPDEDYDDFLRALARDPERLAAWFAGASAGDPRAFEESLMELVRVSGSEGFAQMLDALAQAFARQRPEAKDALLSLAIDRGPTRDLTGAMFSLLSSGDIASSILGGRFGRNMLSLSAALTQLPLDRVTAEVRANVQAMLPTSGHSTSEGQFLEHMIQVRQAAEPEPALVDIDETYRTVLEASQVTDELREQGRKAVAASHGVVSRAAVRTMLLLLDQHEDFELYQTTVDSLGAIVPRLAVEGDLALASSVLSQLALREARESGASPKRAARLRAAMSAAGCPETMRAVLQRLIEDPGEMPQAREIVRHTGDNGPGVLVAQAIALKSPGLDAAEQLLGRRFVDALAQQALSVQWFDLAPVAIRLARESDPRSIQTLEALLRRPDEQSRREVAAGIAEVGGPGVAPLLARALRDSNPEVSMIAARAAARSGQAGTAAVLSARLAELDVDNTDFLLGRELIAALARLPEPDADDALDRLAARRSLIKRGRFNEVQSLVNEARSYRAGGVR